MHSILSGLLGRSVLCDQPKNLLVLFSRAFPKNRRGGRITALMTLFTLICVGCQADPENSRRGIASDVVPSVGGPIPSYQTNKKNKEIISSGSAKPDAVKPKTESLVGRTGDLSKKLLPVGQEVITTSSLSISEPQKRRLKLPTHESKPRIGVLLPLSEKGFHVGRALLDAIQLAFFEAADDQLELIIFDTRGNPTTAIEAAKLAVKSNVELILGPLFGSSTEAIAPTVRAAGVEVISFSNDIAAAGNGVYIFGFLPGQQVKRIIQFSTSRGYKRIGVLAPKNEFGDLAVEIANESALGTKSTVVRESYYEPGIEDLTSLVRNFSDYQNRQDNLRAHKKQLSKQRDEIAVNALRRLSELETLGDPPFDSVLLPSGGPELKRIAPLLAFYDVDPARVKLLGTTFWDDMSDLTIEPALLGSWYVAPSPELLTPFYAKFKGFFGYQPPRLATLGYDAMLLGVTLALLKRMDNYKGEAIIDSRGYSGVDGIVRLLPDGSNERGFAILEVQQKGVKIIDEAPIEFNDHDRRKIDN
ncbi:MAG: hypothetical protein CMM58_02650 [Rhodospirillaceae bacterium]|nr:hypothetical protein [Rhodospirillaceae bacterium]|tara:strand:+ start:257 stop:1846 length:1590 start_codon:yes stop_codon:yes gene_type:complete